MDEKTCAERIAEHLKGREEYLAALYEVANGDGERDDDGLADVDGERLSDDEAQDRIHELPLSVSVIRTLRIDLSTGGPADYLTAELDGSEVQSVTYHFADWFDHAEMPVPDDSKLWDFAVFYAEMVDES